MITGCSNYKTDIVAVLDDANFNVTSETCNVNGSSVKFKNPGFFGCNITHMEIDLGSNHFITALKIAGVQDIRTASVMVKFKFQYFKRNEWLSIETGNGEQYVRNSYFCLHLNYLFIHISLL